MEKANSYRMWKPWCKNSDEGRGRKKSRNQEIKNLSYNKPNCVIPVPLGLQVYIYIWYNGTQEATLLTDDWLTPFMSLENLSFPKTVLHP